jgi:hypothetical protein
VDETAVIHVERDKSLTDAMRAYKVIVDGETAGKVRRGKNVSVDVAPGPHEVWMKVDWTKSGSIELDLQPGEEATLICSPNRGVASVEAVTLNKDSYISLERKEAPDSAAS